MCSSCNKKSNIQLRRAGVANISTSKGVKNTNSDNISIFVRDDCGYGFDVLTAISLKCLRMMSDVNFGKNTADYKLVYEANSYITKLMAKMQVISACKYLTEIGRNIKTIESVYEKYVNSDGV